MGELLKEFSPTIMNATNGKTKDGATFEYSHLKNLMGIDLTREPGCLKKRTNSDPVLRTTGTLAR